MDFNDPLVSQLIDLAITEDIGDGDHSSHGAIHAGTEGNARLLVKDNGIICGISVAKYIMHLIDEDVKFNQLLEEGSEVKPGDVVFTVHGSVHSILQAERLMLNFMQRMSGVATITHELVQLLLGTNARLLDTRKTTPGLRTFEKYAVTVGGGVNHRFALWDMVMLKDNHNDYAGSITNGVMRTKKYLTTKNKSLKIEVETRNLEEIKEALHTGLVDRIMFDNFTPELMTEAVKLVNGICETEASGGITRETIRSYAETGVDYISVGALTHSVKSLDLSLKEY
ncbi:MAG TPA: carboxylating nicotinate-nucleotide diphosphorylase [Bacteroidetes bacterium]|jgi:nicotinate-nucleotide pyrophosphorylase (carboxylating)|nr:carboxylating nicotinate-nucleotide diphosphorylase [Bacteroidota bacterium]|tara:strand:+ start:526 stop:1374 length:849 start_codon:yes stop_codon:yes gene_type:complete